MRQSRVVERRHEADVLPHRDARRALVGLGLDQLQDRVDDFLRVSPTGLEVGATERARADLVDVNTLERSLEIDLTPETILVTHHPVTLDPDPTLESVQVLRAIEHMLEGTDRQIIFCHPNADAGGRWIARRVEALCHRHPGRVHLLCVCGHVRRLDTT